MKNPFSTIKEKREEKKEQKRQQKKNKIMNAISWSITAWLFLFALVFMPSIGSVLMALGGIIVMPVSRLQEILREKLKIRRFVKVLLVIALFIAGTLTVPLEDTETVDLTVQTEMVDDVSKDMPELETVAAVLETAVEDAGVTDITVAEETTTESIGQTEESAVESEEVKSEETTLSETETEAETTTAAETEEQIAEDSTFSIHYIDVGQADAALVECDGHYLLIDGGNKADSSRIYSILKKEEVPKLDMIVGTHAHEDHIGGLPGALNYTTADKTLCPVTSYDSDAFQDFKKYADRNGGGITVPKAGEEFDLGSASVKIVGVNGGSDANDTSIVLKITYGETSFLFTGDAEREAEQAVLADGYDISATVLKVGHHGSDTSTTYPFLREIMPEYAVISVGEGNSYGHPTDNTLSRLRDADVKVLRTDLQGDIYCTSDGKTVTFTTERVADESKLMKAGSVPVPETTARATEAETTAKQTKETDKYVTEVTPGTDYVLNTNTKKFHYPSCGSVKKMKDKNKREYTGTRDEVIGMGYDPCGNCHP